MYVYDNLEISSGLTIVVGTIAWALWFYADFSGYMDIMLGISSTFHISLPENFRQPFFSKSVAEYWRRWHITLGAWFRDYVMMIFVQSKYGRKLRKHYKKYSKNASRLVPILVGTFFAWICTAIWHEISWRYLLWGIYFCFIISTSLVLESVYDKTKTLLGVSDNSKIYNLFCILRTFGLVLISDVILSVSSLSEISIIIKQIVGRSFLVGNYVNIANFGWKKYEIWAFFVILVMWLVVSILKEKGYNVLEIIDKQRLPIRWIIYYALLFTVLVCGMYGSQYDATQFAYMQF